MASTNGKYLMFRGKPLVRQDNIICYGSMNDKYILFMLILSTKKLENAAPEAADIQVPDQILVQILSTDTTKSDRERMVKQFTKSGLYDAMEIGLIWLDQLNGATA